MAVQGGQERKPNARRTQVRYRRISSVGSGPDEGPLLTLDQSPIQNRENHGSCPYPSTDRVLPDGVET